jgi:hypothetical protein
MGKRILCRTVLAGLAGVMLIGCATIRPDLKPMPSSLFVVKRAPLKIAVIVSPDARNLTTLTELPTFCWGGITVEKAGYGQLFEQTLRDTLAQAYEQVDLVSSVPNDATHHAVLIASISQVAYRFGCPASPENYAEVSGSLSAVDAQGKEVWRSGVTSKRVDAGMPMMLGGIDQKYGEDISKTMSALAAEWAQELGRYPTKQWARAGGGDMEEERTTRTRDVRDEEPVAESDVDRPPATKRKAKRNAYAVVFGIEKYREKLPKAEFAARDAKTMGVYLTKVLGYPEENVVVRTNDLASRNDMEKYFGQWLKNNVEPGGTVFIYYSGHGAPNPKTGDAYLVPYDGDPTYVDTTAFPLKRLYESLEKLPAKEIVVVLDSCFSGAGGRSVLAKGAKPMVISVENPVVATGKTIVLAASSGDQMSSSYEEKGHGLMTYFFLKGLQGYADTDEDGNLNMAELYDYVKGRVEKVARKQYNNEQTPQLLGNPAQLKNGGGSLIEKNGR